MLRGVAVVAVAALLLLGFSASAGAQTVEANYPPVTCTVQVVVTNGSVTVTIVCTGFSPGVTITVTIDGEVAGETVVAPDGTAVLDTTGIACGAHEFSATDGTTTVSGTFDVNCEASTPVSPAGTLPYTGNDSTVPFAQLGIALLAVGALITVVVRKRRAAEI